MWFDETEENMYKDINSKSLFPFSLNNSHFMPSMPSTNCISMLWKLMASKVNYEVITKLPKRCQTGDLFVSVHVAKSLFEKKIK